MCGTQNLNEQQYKKKMNNAKVVVGCLVGVLAHLCISCAFQYFIKLIVNARNSVV